MRDLTKGNEARQIFVITSYSIHYTKLYDLAQALVPGFPEPRAFEGDEADLLYRARHYYAAERDAMAYLSRAEHTRRQLTLKLRKKGHEDGAIVRALDRLESREYRNNFV